MDAVIRRNAAGDGGLSIGFTNKALVNVVQKERDKLADYQARAEKLKEQIEWLK